MTDENLNAENSVESQQADSFSQNLEPSTNQQAPEMVQANPQDGAVSREKLDSILSTERKRAYEKGLREANQRVSQQQAQQPAQSYDQSNSIEQKVDTLLNQKIAEMQKQHQLAVQNQQEQAGIARIDSQLEQKLEAARKDIEGFDESLSAVGNFDNFRGIKYAASKFQGDSGKVLHYLSEHRSEIPVLESMASSFRDSDGNLIEKPILDEFKRISDKISLNENSEKYRAAPDPISKIQSNLNEGMGDGSRDSVSDYRTYLKRTRR